MMICEHHGCRDESAYVSPRNLCKWHWHLWFCYGDLKQAKELLQQKDDTP